MTNREFFVAVANATNLPAELTEHAAAQIAKMDAKNAERSSKPSKASIANEPIKVAILGFVTAEGALASEIGVGVGITTAKASSLCNQLVEDGKLFREEVKVPKVGKRWKYFAATAEDADGEDSEIQATDYELNTMF